MCEIKSFSVYQKCKKNVNHVQDLLEKYLADTDTTFNFLGDFFQKRAKMW